MSEEVISQAPPSEEMEKTCMCPNNEECSKCIGKNRKPRKGHDVLVEELRLYIDNPQDHLIAEDAGKLLSYIRTLQKERDGFQRGDASLARKVEVEVAKNDSLSKEIMRLDDENATLRADWKRMKEALSDIAECEWSVCHECEGRGELVFKAEKALPFLKHRE